MGKIVTIYLIFITVMVAATATFFAGVTYANDEATSRLVEKVISEHIDKQEETKGLNFADQNELKIEKIKSKPKTKRYFIFSAITAFIAFIVVNLFAITGTHRFCTKCRYSGKMKATKLSRNQTIDKIMLKVVKILPIFLYAYSESGTFVCPICFRNTTVSLNRKIKEG